MLTRRRREKKDKTPPTSESAVSRTHVCIFQRRNHQLSVNCYIEARSVLSQPPTLACYVSLAVRRKTVRLALFYLSWDTVCDDRWVQDVIIRRWLLTHQVLNRRSCSSDLGNNRQNTITSAPFYCRNCQNLLLFFSDLLIHFWAIWRCRSKSKTIHASATVENDYNDLVNWYTNENQNRTILHRSYQPKDNKRYNKTI